MRIMAAGTKDIKERISSIQNIRKITKAMELVSVSKMRRAVNAVTASRPYAEHAWGILRTLSRSVSDKAHPFLKAQKGTGNVLIVLITSDRGLCGGFNSDILRKADVFISELGAGERVEVITVGKKGAALASRRGWNVVASFSGLSIIPTTSEIAPLMILIRDGFLNGVYSRVYLAYTDFISTIRQEPVIHRLLPIRYSETLGSVGEENRERESVAEEEDKAIEFLFEPEKTEVLSYILPRLVETQIYQALLESIASEHSARMVAMKNASDAAGDIVDDLTFTWNQLRQADITREIAEISAGKAALE